MRRLLAASAAAATLLAALMPAIQGAANGVPQLVKLTYLEGVSNWGPRDAEGVLEFSFAEAYARVDVKRLPPAEGYTYEGWMVAPDGSAYLVGTIPVDADGIGTLDTKLQGLTRYDYNLFVVAARGPSDPPGQLPPARSIAGRFTVIADSGQRYFSSALFGDEVERVEIPEREHELDEHTVAMLDAHADRLEVLWVGEPDLVN